MDLELERLLNLELSDDDDDEEMFQETKIQKKTIRTMI